MNTDYNVINSEKYFYLLKKDELNEQEEKKVNDFEALMFLANKYNDYLINDLKQNKDSYEKGINQLAIIETEHKEIPLTNHEKRAIEAYNKQKNYTNEFKEGKVRKLEKDNDDVSGGFTNAFVLVLSVLATGILVGLILFSVLK